jgi:hypothetical protein
MHIIKRFRALPVVPKEVTKVIVRTWTPLTEQEIEEAFKGNETTQWWRALVQILDESMNDYVSAAAQQAGLHNELAMAREIGAHEALSNLLTVLEKKTESD